MRNNKAASRWPFLLAFVLLPGVAHGQGQGGGQDRPNPARVCFYEDFDFAGATFCVNPNGQDSALDAEWNDRISSIRVGRNTGGVQVCRDSAFGGGCEFFGADVPRLNANLNDAASSFRVGQLPVPAPLPQPLPQPPPAGGQVCFYEHFDYAGASICRGPGEVTAALAQEWNDRISSIRLDPSVWVQVCSDFNFQGQCSSVGSSVPQLSPAANDNISSFRIFAR
jgi:hypothetical protein